ncbi:MAG: PH domain-containing protein [Cellulosilyticaceae bacterium]
MLKKLAADAFGISDIGKIISPEDFGKVDSDDYIMHEDGEKIYFLIKSKTDEYCFTNLALVHLDGNSAVSAKRMLTRYDYYRYSISDVLLETAGTVDLDVEIKFTIGEVGFSIDVDKKQLEHLKDLYKTLAKMAMMMEEEAHKREFSKQSIQTATEIMSSFKEGNKVHEEFEAVNEYVFNWLSNNKEKYSRKDYGEVFEKYINN